MIQEQLIPASDRAKIKRLKSKLYRDAYLEAQIHGWISHQFRALRASMGLTQKEMAQKIGKPQSVVSRLENDEYGKVSLQTLLDVAKAIDIALLVQFVSYPDFLARLRDKTSANMVPENLTQSIARVERSIATEARLQFDKKNSSAGLSGFGMKVEGQGVFGNTVQNQSNNFNRSTSDLICSRKPIMHNNMRAFQ